MFFVLRLIVATAGITFVIGIQHVAEWFEDENLGPAEGIYAGVGNAGAAGGALILPRVFGSGWNGPLFTTDWRAAFLYTGIVSILFDNRLLHHSARPPTPQATTRQSTKSTALIWLPRPRRH